LSSKIIFNVVRGERGKRLDVAVEGGWQYGTTVLGAD